MELGLRAFLIFTFLLLNTINIDASRKSYQPSELLSKLLGGRSRKPIIVMIDVDKRPSVSNLYQVPTESDEASKPTADPDYDEEVKQQAVQILHNIVKSPDRKDEDEDTLKMKRSLRQGLIARCGQVNQCVRKCPKKRKFKCVQICQEIFDDSNLCEEPTTCKPPRRGKTMPPKWRL